MFFPLSQIIFFFIFIYKVTEVEVTYREKYRLRKLVTSKGKRKGPWSLGEKRGKVSRGEKRGRRHRKGSAVPRDRECPA